MRSAVKQSADEDVRWMSRALELARLGEGLTRPNPPVGAVIVRAGRLVGEGWHRKAGGPHAEIHALRQAGDKSRGATIYVTLEPCSTFGRTPPCTDALIAAGIRRVVVACKDPNPKHAGRGIALLRRKGLQVIAGVCESDATRLIEPFAKWISTGRPFVTLKLGMTMDGRIADRTGRSRWITGSAARDRVQALRRRVDAVMVGRRTVEADDPSLMPRPAKGRAPLRVIVDSSGACSARCRVFCDEASRQTLLATCAGKAVAGPASVVNLPRRRGGVSLPALMAELGRRGTLHVLCEGGGELAAGLLRDGLVDEIVLFVAPMFLGGKGVAAVGGDGWLLDVAPQFRLVEVERVGDDAVLVARPMR